MRAPPEVEGTTQSSAPSGGPLSPVALKARAARTGPLWARSVRWDVCLLAPSQLPGSGGSAAAATLRSSRHP
eukprot:1902980-Pyramimonas_sp.AAC.1